MTLKRPFDTSLNPKLTVCTRAVETPLQPLYELILEYIENESVCVYMPERVKPGKKNHRWLDLSDVITIFKSIYGRAIEGSILNE